MPEETIDLLVPDGDEEKVIGRSIEIPTLIRLIHIFFCFSNVMSAIYSMFQEFVCIPTLRRQLEPVVNGRAPLESRRVSEGGDGPVGDGHGVAPLVEVLVELLDLVLEDGVEGEGDGLLLLVHLGVGRALLSRQLLFL